MIKARTGNKTVLLMSVVFVFFYALLALQSFSLVPSAWQLFTPLGIGIVTILGAGILLLETFYEGKKPNMAKELTAQINVGMAVVLIVFGLIVLVGNIVIAGMWVGVLGTLYAVATVLLLRELLFD